MRGREGGREKDKSGWTDMSPSTNQPFPLSLHFCSLLFLSLPSLLSLLACNISLHPYLHPLPPPPLLRDLTSIIMVMSKGRRKRGSLRTLKRARDTNTLDGVSSDEGSSELRWERAKVTKVAKVTCKGHMMFKTPG